ncbi:hypothetical protein M9Y10_036318 [Tritrichomonas musculus]|uniref:C2H2-type domain-containing protein n=1 Tax=Tritrichomonas musculus TaxID=1915356 RepID=A0ABR2GKL2_9EUKA
MFKTIETHKVGVFRDHFSTPDMINGPGHELEKHPQDIYFDINDWVQSKEFPIIFTLKENVYHFYCSKCNHWYSLMFTFAYIKSHIKSKHLIKTNAVQELNENEDLMESLNPEIPIEIDKLISDKYKSMILKTGRPFAMVENADMKSVLKFLYFIYDINKLYFIHCC